MREALSNNHSSFDHQVADVVSWLSNDKAHSSLMDTKFQQEFPEYNDLTWSGAWVDWEVSNVDVDYMCFVLDWIEAHTLVYWEDGEPWIGSDSEEEN